MGVGLVDLVGRLGQDAARARILNPGGPMRTVSHVRMLFRLEPPATAPGTLWVAALSPDAVLSPRLDGLILDLDRHGAAGLALPMTALPASVPMLAARLGLPLAALADDLVDDAMERWRSILESSSVRDLERVEGLKSRLLDLWPQTGPLEAYLKDAGAVIGGDVRLVDGRTPPAKAGLIRHIAPIPWGQGTGDRLAVDLPAALAGEAVQSLVHHVAAVVAMRIDRDAAAIASDIRLRGELLLELVVSESLSGSALRAAQRFDLDLGRKHLVILWDMDGFTALVQRRDVTEAHILRLKRDVVESLERTGLERFGRVWVLPHSDEFVVVAEAEGRAMEAPGGHRAVEGMQGALAQVLRRHGVSGISAGIGYAYAGSAGLRKSFGEAREALMVGVSQFGPKSVTHFRDLGIHRFLYGWVESPRSRGLASDFLRPLVEDDARGRAALVRTLRVWLEARGKTSAAQGLGIHRNTLTYRLGRIEELLHVDLGDPSVRLVLQLLVRALPDMGPMDKTHEN